jgi:hypothetical protein
VLGPDGDISMPFRSLVANHVAASKRFPLLAAKLHAPINGPIGGSAPLRKEER